MLTATMTRRKLVRRRRKQKVLQKHLRPRLFRSFRRNNPVVIRSITKSELIPGAKTFFWLQFLADLAGPKPASIWLGSRVP